MTESNGRFTRTTRLPVVCEGNQDPSSVLEALFKQPSSYVHQRVHVLDVKPPLTATRFVFVGQLGLLGGSPDKVDGPSTASKATEVLTLPELIQKKKIVSTIALAKAFNAATPSKKAALSEWANEYVEWLEDSTVGNSVKKSGAYLKEYALLANVLPKKAIHKDFRREQFKALVQKVMEDQTGQVSLMESLESCLTTLDKTVLSDKGILHFLASGLLLKLDQVKHPMTKNQFNLRRSTLYCCYYVLSLLKESSPSSSALDPDNAQSLYSQFTSRMESIGRAKFYPYTFHAQLLTQWMTALQAEKVVGVGGRLKQGVSGAFGIYKSGVALATGDVEGFVGNVSDAVNGKKLMGGIYSGYNAVRKRISQTEEEVLREWYDLYIVMNRLTEEILREEDTPEELGKALKECAHASEEAKKHLAKGNLTLSKEAEALSYILILSDGRLALEPSNGELRTAALKRLRNLIDPKEKPKGIKCLEVHGLCEVYLDLLATIACHGVEESDKNFAKDTLTMALNAEKAANALAANAITAKIAGLTNLDKDVVKENVTRWLKNKELDKRLASIPPPPKECELGALYGIVLRRLASKHEIPSEMIDCLVKANLEADQFGTAKKTAAKNKETVEVDNGEEEDEEVEEEMEEEEEEEEDYFDEEDEGLFDETFADDE